MSTYVMSDIHGHKDELDLMLEKIGFSEDDELWILGDIIDKGSKSGEMLIWAIDEAPENVHFLLGNHEDMAYSSLAEHKDRVIIPRDHPWEWNDGWNTLDQVREALGETVKSWESDKVKEFVHEKMLPWIFDLEVFKVVEVNGRKFMLVHGGFDSGMYDSVPEGQKCPDLRCDGNYDRLALKIGMDVPEGFGRQFSQDMMWQREKWVGDGVDAPIDTVFGHTYINKLVMDEIKKEIDKSASGGGGKIAHFNRKHGIECGCARSWKDPEGLAKGLYNLACLRLDDMEEFYVPIKESKKRIWSG